MALCGVALSNYMRQCYFAACQLAEKAYMLRNVGA